jgi:hypothetical protein
MLTRFRLPLVTRLVIYSVLVAVAVPRRVITESDNCGYRTEYRKG